MLLLLFSDFDDMKDWFSVSNPELLKELRSLFAGFPKKHDMEETPWVVKDVLRA